MLNVKSDQRNKRPYHINLEKTRWEIFSRHTSTSCGANRVASLTADGIVSSILNAGKFDTILTSGTTFSRLQKSTHATCKRTKQILPKSTFWCVAWHIAPLLLFLHRTTAGVMPVNFKNLLHSTWKQKSCQLSGSLPGINWNNSTKHFSQVFNLQPTVTSCDPDCFCPCIKRQLLEPILPQLASETLFSTQ